MYRVEDGIVRCLKSVQMEIVVLTWIGLCQEKETRTDQNMLYVKQGKDGSWCKIALVSKVNDAVNLVHRLLLCQRLGATRVQILPDPDGRPVVGTTFRRTIAVFLQAATGGLNITGWCLRSEDVAGGHYPYTRR